MRNKEFFTKANIHTIEIRTNYLNVTEIIEDIRKGKRNEDNAFYSGELLADKINRCIDTEYSRLNFYADKYGKTFILNLNKWHDDGTEIYSYAEFDMVLTQIMDALGIDKYTITRVDLKFDSEDPNFFEDNKKIIRLVMAEISYKLKIKNFLMFINAQTLKTGSIKLQSSGMEIEYCDKTINQNDASNVCARLSLRLKNNAKGFDNLGYEFTNKLNKLKDAVVNPETGKPDVATAYLRCNENLLSYWKDGNYTSAIDFLRHDRFRELIFTRKQLREFLRLTYSTDDLKIEGWIKNNVDRKKGKLTKYDFCDARNIPSLCDCLMMASEKFFQN